MYPRIPSTAGQGHYPAVVGQGSRQDHHSPSSLPHFPATPSYNGSYHNSPYSAVPELVFDSKYDSLGGLLVIPPTEDYDPAKYVSVSITAAGDAESPGFDENLAIPPGLAIDAPTAEAMDVRPGHYGANFLGGSAQRLVSKRQRSERPTGGPVVQGGPNRKFTCTVDGCGKDFSGEWEKQRHVKSIHTPPTIGCQRCNYKQWRKDLFSEHCKKRHPGESIEELMVDLATPEYS